jgi:hypothetical protein
MDRKTGFLLLSSLLVLLPLLGSAYLYFLTENIDQQTISQYDLEEVIDQIETSEDLEAMKKISLYIYLLQMKVIQTQHQYIFMLVYLVMAIGILNGIVAFIFYRTYIKK